MKKLNKMIIEEVRKNPEVDTEVLIPVEENKTINNNTDNFTVYFSDVEIMPMDNYLIESIDELDVDPFYFVNQTKIDDNITGNK